MFTIFCSPDRGLLPDRRWTNDHRRHLVLRARKAENWKDIGETEVRCWGASRYDVRFGGGRGRGKVVVIRDAV